MILSCMNLSKSFGDTAVINDISFHIEDRQKAALIGVNGAGKTTILKMIVGEIEPDSGSVSIAKGTTVGYLAQHQDVTGDETIYSELMDVKSGLVQMEEKLRTMEREMKNCEGEALKTLLEQYNRTMTEFENQNGYAVKSEVNGVLKGLGFTEEEFDSPLSTLSGGQKTRVALGKLLLMKPDLLLLDEPTNHLDLASTSWLENYLLNYDRAMLIVSHDRYFLNKVVSKVIELERGKVTSFEGNYSDYAQKKAQQRESEWRAYVNAQREVNHQEEVITKLKSFNREKSVRRAESREKMLLRMEDPQKPFEENEQMHLHFVPQVLSGKDVLTVTGLKKSYPGNPLFDDLDFKIRRGEKVALIGDNGTGKSTILKILTGIETADAGIANMGSQVAVGYYDQEQKMLHLDKTVFDEVSDRYPLMTVTQIRNVLASFLFTGDEVFKQVKDLSGGERGRLSLAILMISEANFLILDEPTNHLDITSKEILEEALQKYEGTVLFVSHDRYFINQTAQRILELKDHRLYAYPGNYDYYLEKTALPCGADFQKEKRESSKEGPSPAKQDWERNKREQAEKRKISNELKRVEEKITDLEEHLKELEEEMTKEEVYLDAEKCARLGRESDDEKRELDRLYARWEELGELDTKMHV